MQKTLRDLKKKLLKVRTELVSLENLPDTSNEQLEIKNSKISFIIASKYEIFGDKSDKRH